MSPLLSLTSAAPIVMASVILSWVVASLAARSASGRQDRSFGLLALAVIGSLVANGWPSPLGVRGLDSLVMALSVVALGGFLWSLCPLVLRELRHAKKPPLALLALVFGAYLLLLPWTSSQRPPDGDEPWYLLLSHSIVTDGDVDLENNYEQADSLNFMDRALEPQPGDPEGPEGQLYSRHSALLSIVLAAPYLVAGLLGVQVVMCLMTALLSWLLLVHLLATFEGRLLRGILFSWLVFSFTSPLIIFAHQIWVEVPAALLTLVAVLALDRLDGAGENESRRRWWCLLGLTMVLLPWLKLRFGAVAVSLATVALLNDGRRGRLRKGTLGLSAGVALVIGSVLVANQLRFGNPLRLYQLGDVLNWGALTLDTLQHFLGLFWDVAFGLFPAAPIWLLIVLGLAHRGSHSLRLLVIALPYLLAVAARQEWYGGWSPPFRYGLVLLPLLACGLVAPLDERTGRRQLVVWVLAAPTLLLTVLWVTIPGWTYNVADGGSFVLEHLIGILGLDLWTLAPSATRPLLAIWLWPAASLALLWLAWRRPGKGKRQLQLRNPATALVILLVMVFTLLELAQRRATTRIELESPAVFKIGGTPEPGEWQVNRTQYPEAWVLPEGAEARTAITAGGRGFEITLLGRHIANRPGPTDLQILCGDRVVATVTFDEPDIWRTVEATVENWSSGEDLVLRVPEPDDSAPPHVVNGLALDFARIRWL